MISMLNFFIIVAIGVFVYWCLIPTRWRSLFLFICSLCFIALLSLPYAFYFLFNIVFVYVAGVFISREDKNKRIIIKLILIWLVGNLCFFKYANLLLGSIFKSGLDFKLLSKSQFFKILFPLGLSYIIFRLIHYIVEVYRNNVPRGSFLNFALYILFFPTFLAGPVERFQKFLPQINRVKSLNISNISYGLFRIICGLVRKIIIADNLQKVVMPVLLSPQSHTRAIVILAIYGLAIQIYMDFSGYTDIAIGISRLFGYKIMENFNRPFFQKNIALFWRNWHISVYSWIRDYFFFPVFGSRASTIKLYIGILISMVVFHIWHAASLGFLILGIYHGTGLIIWQLFQEAKKRQPLLRNLVSHKWLNPISSFLTFSFVSFGFIFFNFEIYNSLNIIKLIFT